jgi:hypothetical protein
MVSKVEIDGTGVLRHWFIKSAAYNEYIKELLQCWPSGLILSRLS